MDLDEPFIQTDHPPHTSRFRKKGFSLARLAMKVILLVLISSLSIHLPDFTMGIQNREQIIEEIKEVLEKHSKDMDEGTKRELAEAIYEDSLHYNHDPKFILALISIESSFQNMSVSERGAKGLMQLMPYVAESLAQELGIEWKGDPTLFNPFLNVRMGIHYLSQLLLDFNDIRMAIVAYNYGPTYVRGRIERKESIPANYYNKVITVYQTL